MPLGSGTKLPSEWAEAIAAGMPKCPVCERPNTRPSVQVGLKDVFMAWASYLPYRCRVCQHRFYKRVERHAKPPDAPAT